MRKFIAPVLIAAGAALVAGCQSSSSSTVAVQADTTRPSMAASASVPADTPQAVTPSTSGTYEGACAYTLGDNPAGGTAVATGDIDVTNTGNIGEVIKLKISWPQQGFSPLTRTSTVRLAKGQEQDVQFNHPLTSDQLDNLQNWQTSHGFKSGCTYNGTIVSTFGTAS
ncbi:MAG TPA: hypothetical protein VHE33_10440 [Acidobacteriaceae bacterium]|nr:hypothetical protein [Acidobacteriaceae bacterium]